MCHSGEQWAWGHAASVPCPAAVMAKAQPSPMDALVLLPPLLPRLSPPASTACQFSPHFYPKSALMYFKPIISILSRAAMAGSSPPSFASSPQAGEGQETSSASSALSEWDCGQGEQLRRASALHFGHSICPTPQSHLPDSLQLLPLPRSPLTVTAWGQWHRQLGSNSALKAPIPHSRLPQLCSGALTLRWVERRARGQGRARHPSWWDSIKPRSSPLISTEPSECSWGHLSIIFG